MRFNKYPVLRLLIALVIGILIAYFIEFSFIKWYYFFPILAMLSFLAFPRKYLFPYRFRYFTGSYIYFAFIVLGILTLRYHSLKVNSNYIGKYVNSANQILVKVIEPPRQTEKTVKLFVSIKSCNTIKTSQFCYGKAVLYLQKDSNALNIVFGDILVINKNLKPIQQPSSPDQFDYASYLSLQDIYYQQYIKSGEWYVVDNESKYSITRYAISIRQKLLQILEQNSVHGDELSVAAGMILGQRDLLSPELRKSYAGAGAMHILCVSGLHVGIIYLILNFLFIKLSNRHRDLAIKAFIILVSIWIYAIITGLSPSVVRSAIMFTFITLGKRNGRKTNIIGSISSSALALLILNPNLLFDIGFQLSYSAVFAIVILQKHLVRLWTPINGFVYTIWNLIIVSIAAQIGTAPLSIYYFHQFPNLFIVTNLIVIPAAYLIIVLGLFVLLFSFIPVVSAFIGKGLSYTLLALNNIITYIEHLPYAVSRDLYISLPILILTFLLIISISYWLIKQKKQFIYVNLLLVILSLLFFTQNYDRDNEFIIYPDKESLYMAIYSNNEAWIICDTSIYNNPNKMSFQVKEHELHKGIRKRHFILLDSLQKVETKTFSIDFPYCKIGNIMLNLDGKRETDSLYNIRCNYYIFNSLTKNNIVPNDKTTKIIICNNISPWIRKKLIYNAKKQSVLYFDIKENGAWRIRF